MNKNVGVMDRNIRIALGIIFLLAGLLAPLTLFWRIVLLILAAIALVTAFTGFCPLLRTIGINTKKKKELEHQGGAPREEPSR